MKKSHRLPALSFLAGWFLLQAAPAVAANINIVWTSEVGQFAPLWVTSEVISGAAPGVFQGLRAWSRWEC
jgi:hypothetical protein